MTHDTPRIRLSAQDITVPLLDPNAALPTWVQERATGQGTGPWDALAPELELGGKETDGPNALALRRHCRFDLRTASDPQVWHYATVVRFRDYVHARWNPVKEERILGNVRRNALARLWWTAHTLDADDGASDDEIVKALGSSARLALQIVDFNGFHGRPWLARAVVRHLLSEVQGELSDKRVDAFFKALGQLSAVRVLERFQDDPGRLIQQVEEELIQSEELDESAA
ncbi:MAG: DUF6339 family protein [Planctomycetota bacterium]|jgi:hypothetical protein